jgi:hypothetical protein
MRAGVGLRCEEGVREKQSKDTVTIHSYPASGSTTRAISIIVHCAWYE